MPTVSRERQDAKIRRLIQFLVLACPKTSDRKVDALFGRLGAPPVEDRLSIGCPYRSREEPAGVRDGSRGAGLRVDAEGAPVTFTVRADRKEGAPVRGPA